MESNPKKQLGIKFNYICLFLNLILISISIIYLNQAITNYGKETVKRLEALEQKIDYLESKDTNAPPLSSYTTSDVYSKLCANLYKKFYENNQKLLEEFQKKPNESNALLMQQNSDAFTKLNDLCK